jgi:membrane-bound inhibitor of C-type lysozyme
MAIGPDLVSEQQTTSQSGKYIKTLSYNYIATLVFILVKYMTNRQADLFIIVENSRVVVLTDMLSGSN